MKKLLLYLLLFSLFISAKAQQITGSIEGIITDKEGEPLPGISVVLQGTTYGTPTDINGAYLLQDVPEGTYNLIISAIGFESYKQDIIVSGGETLIVNHSLSTSTTQLQTVEVLGRPETDYKSEYSFVATKVAIPVKDLPVTVSTITKELMFDQQLYRSGDIAKNVAGVNESSLTTGGLVLRGFRGNTVLLNGLRTNFNAMYTLPIIGHYERVEVIKGPNSALIGSIEPGGVVNYVTKKPLKTKKQSVSFSAGSWGTIRGLVDLTGPLNETGKVLYRLNIAHEQGETFMDNITRNATIIAPSFTFLPAEGTSINVDLTYSRNNTVIYRGQQIRGNDFESTPISFGVNQLDDHYIADVLSFNASLVQKITDNISFNVSYLRNNFLEDNAEHGGRFADAVSDTIVMSYFVRKQTLTTDNMTSYFTADFETGKFRHKALIGFDYAYLSQSGGNRWYAATEAQGVPNMIFGQPNFANYYNPLNYQPTFFRTDGDARTRQRMYGFYLQDFIEAGRFKVLLGLRQEYYRDIIEGSAGQDSLINQNAFLPRVGLTYVLDDQTNVYGSYVTGFTPVRPLFQIDPSFGGPFDPEDSYQFELGIKRNLFNNRLLATISAYQIKRNNVLIPVPLDDNPDNYEQRGQTTSQGVEIEATGKITDGWSLLVNYALNEAKITKDEDESNIGKVQILAPHHQGGFWSKYVIQDGDFKGLGVGVGYNFVSGRRTNQENLRIPAYGVADAAVYYNFDRYNLSANINNVFDKKHWVGGFNSARVFPGNPRNFMVTIGYTF